jgi:hypothetical protein
VLTSVQHEDFDPRLQQQADEQLLVKFEIRPRKDAEASSKEGRPIYRDIEYINIRAPGSSDNVIRPATQRDRERFARHYAAFKNRVGNEEIVEGTLLSEWPVCNRSQVEELAFFGIKTVEQLANTSDANGQAFMGFNGLKRKANEWLQAAAQGVKLSEMQAELAKRDEVIAELKAKLDGMPAPKKKASAKKEE